MKEDYVNEELYYMRQNDLNDENKIGLDEEEGEKSTQTVNEDVIHSNINEKETETNRDTLEEVIYEFPNDTYQVVMEDYENEELDDSKHNYLIE